MAGKYTEPFYRSQAWRQAREARLAADNYLCQRCLRRNILAPAEMVHHIKPLKQYPEYALDIDNLTSLCNACHEKVEQRGNKKKAINNKSKARIIISKPNEINI